MASGARSGKWVISRKFYWTVLLWPTNQRELEAVSVAGGPGPLLQPFPPPLGMWGPGWMWERQPWAVLGAVPCLSPQGVCRGTCHQDRERRPGSGDPRGLCPHLGRAVSSVVTLEQEAQRALRGRETGGPAPLAQSLLGPSLLRISRCHGQGPPASPGGVRLGVFAGGRAVAETGTPLLSLESQGDRCTSYWPPSGTERGGAPCRQPCPQPGNTPPQRVTVVPPSSARTHSPFLLLCHPVPFFK